MALSKGCTIGLIIVGIIVLLLIIGGIFLWIYKDEIMEAGIDYLIDSTQTEMVANLPEGYTEADVNQIMGDLKTAIKEGQLVPEDIQGLAQTFQLAMADKTIDQEEGAKILTMIQEALGQDPVIPEEIGDDSLEVVPDSI